MNYRKRKCKHCVDSQFCVSEEDSRSCKNWDDVISDFFCCSLSTLFSSLSVFAGSEGLNSISPEREGRDGRKKGAFSGFFGGSIGLLRTWKLKIHEQKKALAHKWFFFFLACVVGESSNNKKYLYYVQIDQTLPLTSGQQWKRN